MSPKVCTVEVTTRAETPNGESPIRRNIAARTGLSETPNPAIKTLYDLAQFNAKRWGDNRCFGTRKIVKIHKEVKKVTKIVDGNTTTVDKEWLFWELGPFTYRSYKEAVQEGLHVGAGLVKLGLGKGDKVAIYADTSANWQLMAQGAASQSMPIVTAYATLGEEGLEYSLKETDARAIFLDPQLVSTLFNPLKSSPSVKYVIYHGEPKATDLEKLRSLHPQVTVVSYDDLVKMGSDNPSPAVPPEPADLACIMYTSGSTGRPKGVLLTHRNVVAAISGAHNAMAQFCDAKKMRMLAYLPTAHIYGFVFELVAQYWGSIIGYARIRTLTDTSVRNCKGDLREFQPHFLTSIPAVWELIRKGIEGKIADASPIVRGLFWTALSAKDKMMRYGIPGTSILDAIVLNKVKEATGGHIVWSMYGGSALSEETQRFICAAICPIASGYGLTETSAMGALSTPSIWQYGHTGALETCVESKLVDVPDLGYFTSNVPPQGEVWLRGPSITSGYLDREAETKALFSDDGWLKTGDIGQFDKSGQLRIIDRVKNLVKTLNGEYIAIEKLEATYNTCNLVMSICVYADQNRYKPIAIVVPAEAALSRLVVSKGIASAETSLETLVHDPKVIDAVYAELIATGKKGGLKGMELIQGLLLVSEEWLPENNLLTAARKLNRKNILAKYKDQVEEVYAKTS